jgi:peptidoglycan-associated lipoprotein
MNREKKRINYGLLLSAMFMGCLLVGCSSTKGGMGEEGEEGLSESDLNAQRESRFGAGGIPTAEGAGMFRDVRFDYDSSSIADAARQDIEYNAQVLEANSGLKIQLEGHCDERGTAEYNMALGQRRARAVFDVLVSYGIPAARLTAISYGEEIPLDPAHNDAAWVKNRRVHFSAFTKN